MRDASDTHEADTLGRRTYVPIFFQTLVIRGHTNNFLNTVSFSRRQYSFDPQSFIVIFTETLHYHIRMTNEFSPHASIFSFKVCLNIIIRLTPVFSQWHPVKAPHPPKKVYLIPSKPDTGLGYFNCYNHNSNI
jgi:hypothetical protein